jgi:uncharacterized protein YggE
MTRISLLTLGLFLFPLLACGQTASTINVQGTADMTKQPEVLRLLVKQYGRGKDQEAAKTALVAAEKKLITKLSGAGAEIIVSHASLPVPSQQLQSRYQNMFNMLNQRRLGMGGVNPASSSEANPSCLERVLAIDMKPKGKEKEGMALLADLQEKLRKDYQDLSGMQDALPKEDDNVNANGIRPDLTYYRNDTSLFQNDVRIQIAARVTREDRVKLYAEALRRARSIATDLAEAADMKVGSLFSINSSFSNVTTYYGSSMRAMNAQGEMAKFPITLKEDGSETLTVRELQNSSQGSVTEPLTYQVNLNASFKLEPK